ncbi:MAG: T9SS type A sorting domain-containing protein, partial [Flavobacteriales bacterium]
TCTMVGNNSFSGGSLQLASVEEQAGKLFLFPNPVRDGRVTLQLTGIATDEESTATIEVFDAMGRLIHSEQAMAADGELNHVMSLDKSIVTGMYQVVLGVSGQRFHQRLLVD